MTSIPASSSSSTSCQRLLVARAGDVGVRELVDERDLRPAREHRVHVHFLEDVLAIRHRFSGHDLEPGDLVGRLAAAVCLDEADDDVLAVFGASLALVQHRERLADAGCGAEVDAERPSRHGRRLRPVVEREVELEHVHARLAEEAERAAGRVPVDQLQDVGEVEPARLGHPRSLQARVRERDVRVEARAGGS